MSDVAKRVEQGKDDLIRRLMRAKLDRSKAAKNPPAPVEAATEEAPKDGLTEDDAEALAEMYASLK